MIFRMGELFCGPGGLALGALNAVSESEQGEVYKIHHQWANDYDKDSCETYRYNFKLTGNSVICKDVRKLDFAKLKDIDALAFGFPCNDFSVVGKQKGIDGVYGPLYSYGVKALRVFQPKWFLAENVGGLKNANEGSAFETILNDLYESGYNIVPHLYKFEYYGVPQKRHRIIIIGIRNDLNIEFRVPAPTTYKWITSKQAIDLPPILKGSPNHVFTSQSPRVVERLKYIKPGENAFTADIPKELCLNVRGAKISQIYKRLHPDEPAYTVTGSGGGGTHMYHWKENRALTNRERARLQSFPDDFVFYGRKESVRKQIGMAVPPKGAEVIFKAVLDSFAGISYESVENNISFKPVKAAEGVINV